MKILFSKKQNKNGFSLMEVVIAIGIITVGLISIVSLFSQNLKIEIKNKNRLIAIYLANESIEIIRQQRDNNWFSANSWLHDFPALPEDVVVSLNNINDIRQGWEVVQSNNNRKKVYLKDGSYLQYKDTTLFAASEETSFERYLTIETGTVGCLGAGADCVQITSHVLLNGVQLFEVTAYLYNKWR